jgi:2,4-dienoyl-CoA reductase-like NADH-dependent reductase (Old Yellow Enzyme family)/thioredoxin reductase
LKNRLFCPPMVRNYATPEGLVTDRFVAHVESLARGGVGAIILEASFISPEGKGFTNELGVNSDAVIPGLKRLADAAHKYGAALGIQLYHAGRQTSVKTTGTQPVAPSPIPCPLLQEMPKELDLKEIKRLVAAYGAAAKRAKAAGLDFVEIHGAHGYLITQFLSPFSNKRTDDYGGSADKRLRFALEVVESVRQNVGPDYPVTCRLSGEEMVPGGLLLKDTVLIAKQLEKAGVDAFHVSVGNYGSYVQGWMIPPMAVKDAPLVRLAAGVKAAVKVPVITVGKIRTPDLAEKILAAKKADFVAIGRSLLADPEWPNKALTGRAQEIMPCIACNQGCISRLFAQQDVWCTVNPKTGRELEFAKPNGAPKVVLVAGGGPAGMMAAKVATLRGHRVILIERDNKLGGQLYAAEAAPLRQGWREFREALTAEIGRLPIEVRLKTPLTLELVDQLKPDAIILALGADAAAPKIPGVTQSHVFSSRDILLDQAKAKGKVVVIGGGCAGAQTAEYLALQKRPTTIVEMTPNVAIEAPIDDRALLLGRLAKLKVTSLTETKVLSIGEREVTIQGKSGEQKLPADTVVLCLGSHSNDNLVAALKSKVSQVLTVGDAQKPRRVTDATAEGALAALQL